ncbi:conserved Plasmodium membrane protein, unknown function [Plasmodium sp. gorilla clade G2]|uniref:conserved Plasmodium membrane protein, unknown function n=1 Tax=Plasmodium sp. gorilla clade G2 TaxID=880535 RepID=UPI000D21F7A3|nr:conserved Plasmodium membrane protein, unknown function [Plasmodium sp. gorilla clade G2]SOV18832.1 conserved Plasmodium membrane protein, unknown function [Plasmodium sp. gorilla clade G2]
MLRNVAKSSSDNAVEDDKLKNKNEIFKKRIHKEIKRLKESKVIDDINVYITFKESNDSSDDKIQSNNKYNDSNSSKYVHLLQTFDEKYFLEENFFVNNFIKHIIILKKNNNISDSYKEENSYISNELIKYYTYKNTTCPFYNIFEILNFEKFFNSFNSFLNEINNFLDIFEIFKKDFMKEQNIFYNQKYNIQEKKNVKENYSEEKDNIEYFTNIFFEIIYKDFISYLSKIQREIINNIYSSDEYEFENFYKKFFIFFNKYYNLKESIVYSFFIFHDYPFSKPFINFEHFPFSIFNKKRQQNLMGENYNKKNVLNTLLKEQKWMPKITLENLFEESKKFVDNLFFYYQYKIYLFYYYLNKHKIFELFFQNNFAIPIDNYNVIYSYIFRVDKKLISNKIKGKIIAPKKNYSNLLYSLNNCECINPNIVFYKFFYLYKKLKSKNYETHDQFSLLRAQKKRTYQYFIYLFFIIFIFFIPQIIKNIYIYNTDETNAYINEPSHILKPNKNVDNYVIFNGYVNLIRTSIHYFDKKEDDNTYKGNSAFYDNIADVEGNEKDSYKEQAIYSNINNNNNNNMNNTNNMNDPLILNNNKTENELIPNIKNKKGEKGKNMFLIISSLFELLLFSLGITYNLYLLRKRYEQSNFVVNICSSMLILYNPILFCSYKNHMIVISIGLLIWSINFMLLKRIFLCIVVYFISIYFNIINIIYFFPFFFIYVYINSRYIIKRGNQIKSQFKSKLSILKYAFIYLIIFMVISCILIYIFFDKERKKEDVFTNLIINPIKYWYHKYFLKVYFNSNKGKNNVYGHNMWEPMKFIINSNIHIDNYYIIKYSPFFITFLFNYFFSVNTIIKFYASLMFSSIIFLFMSYTYFSSNYLLIFIIIKLLLFINILGTSSVLLNILLSSYIIIANDHFYFYTFCLTILYFILHIYLMCPSNNLFQNINYQLKVSSELIKNLYYFFLSNIHHLYEAHIKHIILSFIIIFYPSVLNNLSNEKTIRNIIQKKNIQKKIILCLYSHIHHDYFFIPLSCFSFCLFVMLGILKLYYSLAYIKIAVYIFQFFTICSLFSILMLFYIKRKIFRNFDFLSIPDSSSKRTFPLERSKKL